MGAKWNSRSRHWSRKPDFVLCAEVNAFAFLACFVRIDMVFPLNTSGSCPLQEKKLEFHSEGVHS